MPQRTGFAEAECPIARTLDRVGQWWSILILRDALDGFSRFDEFERNLGIAPAMLTRRLRALVDDGLLERRRYSQRPPRFEYLPTDRGREFLPVLIALSTWGDRHRSAAERSLVLVDTATGAEVDPVLVDRATGRPIEDMDVAFAAGPAAGAHMRARFDRADEGSQAS